jgi:hypothetical protein
MATLRYVEVDIDVDASGDATDFSVPVTGFVDTIVYKPGTLDTGADITVTDEADGRAILTLTNGTTGQLTFRPIVGANPIVNTGAGTPSTVLLKQLPVIGRIKVVTAGGGVSTSGAIGFYITR